MVAVLDGVGSATACDETCSLSEMASAKAAEVPAREEGSKSETDTRGERMEVHEDKNALVAMVVKLPEAVKVTNLSVESNLEPILSERSHVADDLGLQEQPKLSSLLQVVTLDSAEMLDVASAQPLLRQDYLDKAPFSHILTYGHIGTETISQPTGDPYVASHAQFPPLERGRTKKLRDSFEKGSLPGPAAMDWMSRQEAGEGPVKQGNQKEHPAGTKVAPISGTPKDTQPVLGRVDTSVATKPRSMADMVRNKSEAEGPQAFEPDKIKKMGFVSLQNGIPSIYFSGEETKKLADNMGHAVVGKFSHYIPSPQQIQKALANIKFLRHYSWKFINAKHILIQFDDLTDYARLLSGPKGTPVWYVDRHPMRVFKWSPDFDVYCESPIAAIWCNLIGLPIHLFDTEALFAIGKLLGNPIQVDRATANKSRLSFARICVEIDITKPPTEEIILDLCGKEISQQIRWDKIPAYCLDCKHVGHTGSNCYANGKR